jgi:hypothetical protein
MEIYIAPKAYASFPCGRTLVRPTSQEVELGADDGARTDRDVDRSGCRCPDALQDAECGGGGQSRARVVKLPFGTPQRVSTIRQSGSNWRMSGSPQCEVLRTDQASPLDVCVRKRIDPTRAAGTPWLDEKWCGHAGVSQSPSTNLPVVDLPPFVVRSAVPQTKI